MILELPKDLERRNYFIVEGIHPEIVFAYAEGGLDLYGANGVALGKILLGEKFAQVTVTGTGYYSVSLKGNSVAITPGEGATAEYQFYGNLKKNDYVIYEVSRGRKPVLALKVSDGARGRYFLELGKDVNYYRAILLAVALSALRK